MYETEIKYFLNLNLKMGNQKSTLKDIKKITNNHTNTEGTQGLMTLTSDKNSKKNTDILYKEKNKNIYSKRESVDILINKNDLNTMPTENNEIIKNNININKNIIPLIKKSEENNTIEPIEKEYKVSKNNSDSNNKITKEINQNNGVKSKHNIKRTEFNNITIIDNLSNYFPKDVSKEEIDEMVNMALSGSIVDDSAEYIPGQNLTSEQVNTLKQIIYDNITKKENYYKDYSILDQINVKIGMSELNKQIIEKTFFQGKKISRIQSDIIMKSLTKGRQNVKALVIELL